MMHNQHKELFDAIDLLTGIKANMIDFKGDNITFFRYQSGTWSGQKSYCSWKILLDETKTKR